MDISELQHQAASCLGQGQYAEAIALYEQCIEAEPTIASHYWHLGLALLLNGQELEAQGTWLEVLTTGTPEQIDAWTAELLEILITAARQQVNSRNLLTAETIYRQVLELAPEHLETIQNLSVILLEQEQLEAAIAYLQHALELAPDSFDVLKGLGIALTQNRQLDAAIPHFQQALGLQPEDADTHRHLGIALENKGDLEGAIACYRKSLELKPDFPAAYNNLGIALRSQGNIQGAMDAYQQALSLNPSFYKAHYNLGVLFRMVGQFPAAVTAFQQALQCQPDSPEVNTAMGDILAEQGRSREAIPHYQQALQLKSDQADVQRKLGYAFRESGQLEEAIACYHRALSLQPDFPDAMNELGLALIDSGKSHEALPVYQKVLLANPDFSAAFSNLGIALMQKQAWHAAEASLKKALATQPDNYQAWLNRGLICWNQGRLEKAEHYYRKALAINPRCVIAHSNLLSTMLYNPEHTQEEIYQESCRWASQHTLQIQQSETPVTYPCTPARRLRIGYASPDFRRHVIAFFLEPILKHHDRSEFEVFCFAQVKHPDAKTEQYKNLADHWRLTMGLSDAECAEQIRSDGIDILVDLAGHTADNRLSVFAHKPAPVQITYLGYPGTTGLPQMDYRLTDAWADPVGQGEEFYTEELIRLPECFLCYQPPTDVPAVDPLPVLSAGHVTFGCFNNTAKVTPESISVWSAILNTIPTARILLKNKTLNDQSTRDRFIELFAEQGVEASRVQLIGFQPDSRDHLATYGQVDIAFDTFPYNGTTTTCEALWMGVPVITLAGNSHAGRVGVSLLSTVGLHECIASTPEDYIARTVELANNLQHLAELRSQLRQQMAASPLCNAPRFIQQLEAVYRQLWQRWCSGQQPWTRTTA